MTSKTTLFQLKHFHVAIVDEAAQILEPHLSGILAARDSSGQNAIDKFILIGDHNQLAAVVIQSPRDSVVRDPLLLQVGLTDTRKSLFERLYRIHHRDPNVVAMLLQQGRMHPDISQFSNTAFYRDKLQPVPLPHQVEGPPADFSRHDPAVPLQRLLATRRLLFIPSRPDNNPAAGNQNPDEALVIAILLDAYRLLARHNNLQIVPSTPLHGQVSIGVITPYRNQIALARQHVDRLQDPRLDNITIDTVERFQGSQRDIIIYSCAVNTPEQLRFLANTTEEEGVLVDRKLNVAITRARKQLLITGAPGILALDPLHARLLDFIRQKGGYIDCTPGQLAAGEFAIPGIPPGRT